MNLFHAPGPPARTPAGRLVRLNDQLASLAARMKEGVAGAVGEAAADAVRDAVRGLLGVDLQRREEPMRYHEETTRSRGWPERDHADYARTDHSRTGRVWDDRDRWGEDDLDDPGRDADDPHDGKPVAGADVASVAENANRWEEAARAAVQAGAWWLRRQPTGRPLLTTLLVAGAAGLTVLLAGPAIAAALGAGVALVSVAFASDAVRPVLTRLGSLLTR